MERCWDVVVIGSGPAGTAAAIGARAANPAASVLLLDRQSFPRDKCCGDAVLGTAIDLLIAHGVARQHVCAGYPGVHELALRSPGGCTVSRRLPVPMHVIPRAILDARLLAAAHALGAEWRQHTTRHVRGGHDAVVVDGSIRARVVIGADGAESVVRRAVGGGGRRELAVALRGYDVSDQDGTPRLVFDRRPGLAYAWRFPIAGGAANAGYGHLLRPGESAHRQQLLAGVQRLLPGLRIEPESVQAHRLPLSTTRQPVARGRVLLAGDAASLVNPISGEGIYYAIMSGLVAGRLAVSCAPDAVAVAYRIAMRRSLAQHRRHVAVLARLSRSDTLLEAMLRAAHDESDVFADLARIGLAEGVVRPALAARLVRQLVCGGIETALPLAQGLTRGRRR